MTSEPTIFVVGWTRVDELVPARDVKCDHCGLIIPGAWTEIGGGQADQYLAAVVHFEVLAFDIRDIGDGPSAIATERYTVDAMCAMDAEAELREAHVAARIGELARMLPATNQTASVRGKLIASAETLFEEEVARKGAA